MINHKIAMWVKVGVKVRYVGEFVRISLKDGHIHRVFIPMYVRFGLPVSGMKKPQVLRWGWGIMPGWSRNV